MAARPEPWRSPAMAAAMQPAPWDGTSLDEVAHLDLYSCFASSLSFAATPSGSRPAAGLTVTGGLPYHGGPGSNYSTHALAAMAEALRRDPGSLGLVSRDRDAHDQLTRPACGRPGRGPTCRVGPAADARPPSRWPPTPTEPARW